MAVVARAGFGKSTAVTQAVAANRDAPVGTDVVVTVSRRHRAPASLVGEIGRAIGAPTWEADPVDGLESIVSWAARQRWRQDLCLVLDDVHLLADSGGEQVVRRLAARSGTSLHVVLASRTPLPWLATHRARGDVADLDEDGLRLDDSELEDLAARRGVAVDRLRPFGGWPAIVDLVATYGTCEADAFLNEEVLSAGPIDRSELDAVATVGGGDDELLGAVLGRPIRSADIAARVPLTSLSPAGELVVHPLWTELLEVGDETARRVRRIAATHWCRRRDHRRAVELALPTGDEDLLAEALIGAFCDPDRRPDAPEVSEWLAQLPAGLHDRPAGLFLRGADAVRRDPYGDRPETLLEQVAAAWRDEGRVDGEPAVLNELAAAAFTCGDRGRLAELRERAGGDAAPPASRGVVQLVDGATALLDGRRPAAPTGGPSWCASALTVVARADPVDHPGRSELRASQPALAAVIDSAAAWHRGDLQLALGLLSDPPVDVARFDRYLAAVELTRLHARAGRLESARSALDVARSAGPPSGTSWASELTVASIVLAVAEHDDATASRLVGELVERLPVADHQRVIAREPIIIGCLHPEGPELTDRFLSDQDRRVRDDLAAVLSGTGAPDPGRWPNGLHLLTKLPLRWVAQLAAAATETAPSVAAEVLGDLVTVHGERGRRLVRATAAAPLLVRTAVPPQELLRLDVLGPVRLWRGGTEVDHPDWERLRVRELLCLLALGRHTSRDSVAATLWPESDADDAANNLRTHLSMLHSVLEPDRWPGEATWVVRVDDGELTVADPPGLSVDAGELRAALDRCRRGGSTEELDRAISSWRGRPLADLGDGAWVEAVRAELSGDLVDAAVTLGAAAIAEGRPDRAVVAAIDALQLDPWTEAGYQLLVSAYLAGGDRAAALRALDRCDAMLADLGVTPDATTLELRRRLT